MKTVWKYTLDTNDYTEIEMPIDSTLLTVQDQYSNPQLWVLVNPNENTFEKRRFRLAGTGHPIRENNLKYIGTFQLYNGSFVGHLFEVIM